MLIQNRGVYPSKTGSIRLTNKARENVTHQQGERIVLEGANGSSFEAVQQGHELHTHEPQPGETVFTVLGKYAIHYSPEAAWQLMPAKQWIAHNEANAYPAHPYRWASAEVLRTEASEGVFSPDHMDLLDASLFRKQRVTSAMTKLAIASEEELYVVLQDYNVPTEDWSDLKVHDLYNYTKSNNPLRSDAEVENMTLHSVNGALWLATAQTMLNVYHQAETGQVYRLRETWKTSSTARARHWSRCPPPREAVWEKLATSSATSLSGPGLRRGAASAKSLVSRTTT